MLIIPNLYIIENKFYELIIIQVNNIENIITFFIKKLNVTIFNDCMLNFIIFIIIK